MWPTGICQLVSYGYLCTLNLYFSWYIMPFSLKHCIINTMYQWLKVHLSFLNISKDFDQPCSTFLFPHML